MNFLFLVKIASLNFQFPFWYLGGGEWFSHLWIRFPWLCCFKVLVGFCFWWWLLCCFGGFTDASKLYSPSTVFSILGQHNLLISWRCRYHQGKLFMKAQVKIYALIFFHMITQFFLKFIYYFLILQVSAKKLVKHSQSLLQQVTVSTY